MNQKNLVIISDYRKELFIAINNIYPNVVYGYYCQYLAENIKIHGFWKKYKQLFCCSAFAESKADFDNIFIKIMTKNLNCYNYLRNVLAEQLAIYGFLSL